MTTPAPRPGADLRIRAATPADVPEILALIRELALYEREPDAVVATEDLLHRALFEDALGTLQGGPRTLSHAPRSGPVAECLMGELAEVASAGQAWTVQGFALFFVNYSTWTGRPGLYLEDLFVRPAHRGRGLGRALFTEVARLAARRGCRRMEWAVLDWNTPAIDFYKRLGAVAMSDWTTFRLAGPALDAFARD